ncbi:MAG: hypothetical protein QGF33_13930, partial [Alphaproteobacteria bacterium]|nr:hypothetical protein [Alphaproteobacteria bacterium]
MAEAGAADEDEYDEEEMALYGVSASGGDRTPKAAGGRKWLGGGLGLGGTMKRMASQLKHLSRGPSSMAQAELSNSGGDAV